MVGCNKSSPVRNVWVICKVYLSVPHHRTKPRCCPSPQKMYLPNKTLNMYNNFITTLQETITKPTCGKRKLIFKHALTGGHVSFLEGIPYQTKNIKQKEPNQNHRRKHNKDLGPPSPPNTYNKKLQRPPYPRFFSPNCSDSSASEKKKNRHPFLTERV